MQHFHNRASRGLCIQTFVDYYAIMIKPYFLRGLEGFHIIV